MESRIKTVPPAEPTYEITITLTKREKTMVARFLGSFSTGDVQEKLDANCNFSVTRTETDDLLMGLYNSFNQN